MKKIVMTRTDFEKDGKGWQQTEQEVKEIDLETYNNIVSKETLQYFRRLGGTETATKNYTSMGYNVVKLSSISPDKTMKTIREFEIK
jgi:hypothetical protein